VHLVEALRVLVVEDDPEAAALIVRYLVRLGVSEANVRIAADAIAARLALVESPALAIIRLGDPADAGAVVASQARALGVIAHLVHADALPGPDGSPLHAKDDLGDLVRGWVAAWVARQGQEAHRG